MMLDMMGVEDFEAVPNLESYAFSRVFSPTPASTNGERARAGES
jgi:hypothetical protein